MKYYRLLQIFGHFIILTSIPFSLFVYAELNIYYTLCFYFLYGTFGYYLLEFSYKKQEDQNNSKAIVLRSIKYAFLFILLILIALMLYSLIDSI